MITVYTIYPPIVHVGMKFQASRPHILMFDNWKEGKIKGHDFGIHDTSAYCPRVYQVLTF